MGFMEGTQMLLQEVLNFAIDSQFIPEMNHHK